MSHLERCALLALCLGPASSRRALLDLGEPQAALDALWPLRATYPAWHGAGDVAGLLEQMEQYLARLRRQGIEVVLATDPDYPAALARISGAPSLLYRRGALPSQPLVAVVGSRAAHTPWAELARRLAGELVAQGHGVISGGAIGIDTAAHEGALAAGGPTVAVLGSGLCRLYPERNAELFRNVARAGALLSQYAPEAGPQSWHFPKRNLLIAALSSAVVVVEAASRSGALISARFAAQLGVPVLACDSSCGARALLRQGAGLCESAADVVRAVRGSPRSGPQQALDADQTEALAQLTTRRRLSVTELSAASGWSVARGAAALLRLELAGLVRSEAGGRFALSDRVLPRRFPSAGA